MIWMGLVVGIRLGEGSPGRWARGPAAAAEEARERRLAAGQRDGEAGQTWRTGTRRQQQHKTSQPDARNADAGATNRHLPEDTQAETGARAIRTRTSAHTRTHTRTHAHKQAQATKRNLPHTPTYAVLCSTSKLPARTDCKVLLNRSTRASS